MSEVTPRPYFELNRFWRAATTSSFLSLSSFYPPFQSPAGCLSWHCQVEPKTGDRIPGIEYTLMPKDIEPYLNGRSYKDLKAGDEIAFPELIVPESLVGRRFTAVDSDGNEYKYKGKFDGFDPSTREHAIVFDNGETVSWDIKGHCPIWELRESYPEFVFEGADAYFNGRGVCTIREFPFII